MLKGLTSTFKDGCNNVELTYKEYVKLGNDIIPVKATLKDDVYENGNFIGTFILKEIQFETEATYEFRNKEFEYYKEVDGESIKIGTFISTDIAINDTTDIVKVVGMDYGLKTQVEYTSALDYASGEITLKDVWNECCELSGLESGIEDFANSDFIVDSDQFTGTGATIRDVFKGIAMSCGSFLKVMNDDKVYLVFNEITQDVIEDYVELEDKRDTHPWTCLRLGVSNIDGENVDYIDQELVEEYGENWLILNDNPFAYNQTKRQELIMNIFNQIKEFGYSAFVSKVAFKPYLTCGDVIKFKNRDGDLVKSIVLRYTHSGEEITIEAPSETSATVNYVYPLSAINIAKQTQIIVDKEQVQIDSLTSQTNIIQDNLRENYYTSTQTNELIQTAQTGLTNTFSEAGGNNIFRNTGLWFGTTSSNSTLLPSNDLYPSEDLFMGAEISYEFWEGIVKKVKEEKASNMSAMLLQNGYLAQEQLVPNGKYTISFKYNKLIPLSIAKVYINDVEYVLSGTGDTEFIQVIEVSSQHINIKFNCDVENGCEIYDLMVNAGEVKLAYSQNQNETTTDTVNISKGITIVSSDTDVKFKADSDGIRTLDNSNNILTEFTDEGMKTKTALIENKSTIVGTLWQVVGNQTWITKL